MVANKRLLPKGLVLAAVLSGLIAVPAWSEPVEPLKPEDCDRVRRGLEDGLPFGPGFRRMEVEFPNNDKGIEGQVCRLLTLGTGVHMEGPKIRSLKAMGRLVRDALGARGWAETAETAKFAETSSPGRRVFALSRGGAICVTTVVIDVVQGIAPMIEAYKDGKILLSKLKPHQREWWVSIDCFGVPQPEGVSAVTAKAAPVKTAPEKESPAGMEAAPAAPGPETKPPAKPKTAPKN